MKITYCPECEEKRKANVIQKEETFPVKHEKISIPTSVLVCSKCKTEIFDEEFDADNINAAHNEYRKRFSD